MLQVQNQTPREDVKKEEGKGGEGKKRHNSQDKRNIKDRLGGKSGGKDIERPSSKTPTPPCDEGIVTRSRHRSKSHETSEKKLDSTTEGSSKPTGKKSLGAAAEDPRKFGPKQQQVPSKYGLKDPREERLAARRALVEAKRREMEEKRRLVNLTSDEDASRCFVFINLIKEQFEFSMVPDSGSYPS